MFTATPAYFDNANWAIGRLRDSWVRGSSGDTTTDLCVDETGWSILERAGRVGTDYGSRKWLRFEKRCIQRTLDGDREAFGHLYEAFAGMLYRRVLVPKLGNATAAEDALAETFRTALERLDRYSDRGVSIWYWLKRIAVNKATDMHRVRGRTNRALTNFEGMVKPLLDTTVEPVSPEAEAKERSMMSEAISETLSRLNPRYRRAIELRFLQERSRPECAETMEVKLGTFDVVLLRSLRSFKKHWETVVEEVFAPKRAANGHE